MKISISHLLNSGSQNDGNQNIPDCSTKPLRKRIGYHQIFELKALFDSGIRFPNKSLREKLGDKLGLTPRTIQVWFQNRRQNFKCNQEMQSDLQMASILQSLRKALK